jgi:hypothetical protein
MDKIRIYIASALFILLTAIKLLFPAQMDALRRETLRFAAADRDCKAAVTALGRGLSDRELGERLIAVFRDYTGEETGKR